MPVTEVGPLPPGEATEATKEDMPATATELPLGVPRLSLPSLPDQQEKLLLMDSTEYPPRSITKFHRTYYTQ